MPTSRMTLGSHDAFLALPHKIAAAQRVLNQMRAEYGEAVAQGKRGSSSSHTLKDIERQTGYVWGLKAAMVNVLQQYWCEHNDHRMPVATLDDVERYLRDDLKVIA